MRPRRLVPVVVATTASVLLLAGPAAAQELPPVSSAECEALVAGGATGGSASAVEPTPTTVPESADDSEETTGPEPAAVPTAVTAEELAQHCAAAGITPDGGAPAGAEPDDATTGSPPATVPEAATTPEPELTVEPLPEVGPTIDNEAPFSSLQQEGPAPTLPPLPDVMEDVPTPDGGAPLTPLQAEDPGPLPEGDPTTDGGAPFTPLQQGELEPLPGVEDPDDPLAGTRVPLGDRDCADFATQAEAQQYFESIGGSPTNNADRLDANGNGIACESLADDGDDPGVVTPTGDDGSDAVGSQVSEVPVGSAQTGGF